MFGDLLGKMGGIKKGYVLDIRLITNQLDF